MVSRHRDNIAGNPVFLQGVHFKSVVSSWEREEDNWILKTFVKIQAANMGYEGYIVPMRRGQSIKWRNSKEWGHQH